MVLMASNCWGSCSVLRFSFLWREKMDRPPEDCLESEGILGVGRPLRVLYVVVCQTRLRSCDLIIPDQLA